MTSLFRRFVAGDVTRQQFFDAALTHLREQGRPAYFIPEGRQYGSCVYNMEVGDKTLHCAIGATMVGEDPRAIAKIEGHGVLDGLGLIVEALGLDVQIDMTDAANFLYAVQSIHDDSAAQPTTVYQHLHDLFDAPERRADFMRRVESKAENCAIQYNLTYIPPT